MPSLLPSYNFGSALYNANKDLVRQLDQMYTQVAGVVNTKISKYVTTVNPPSNVTENAVNKTLDIGDLWINSTANNAWIMTSRTTDLIVNWQIIT